MHVKKIKVSNFRNLKNQEIEFKNGVTVFYGANGQGKTNLLEAIFFITNGYSFRSSKTEHLVNKSVEHASLLAEIDQNHLLHEAKVKIERNKKNFILNNKRVSKSHLPHTFPTIVFSPESLNSIKEGPETRRVLIDDFLKTLHFENFKNQMDYKKCLRMRNKVLIDCKKNRINEKQAQDILVAIEGSFLPLATKLATARINLIRQIASDYTQAARFILGDANVEISVDYLLSNQSALTMNSSEIYYAMLQRLEELRLAEFDAGASLVGAHRHEIHFLFEKKDSRYYCSQGQQRALILAFKMAQIMYHCRVHQSYPLLLLDDVLSELDHTRRSNLVKFLNDISSQIVLTTTDINFSGDFAKNEISVFELANGEVIGNGK